jgi:hemerythrin superfamily protein
MDAITLLKDDHRTVARLVREFAAARRQGDPNRSTIVKQMIEELSVHMEIEEQIFYRTVRSQIAGMDDDVLESAEEHHVIRWTLAELADMDPADERYDAKVAVLGETVRRHVRAEEEDWFPKVRRKMTRTRLSEIGGRLEAAKLGAPRVPLPGRDAGDHAPSR